MRGGETVGEGGGWIIIKRGGCEIKADRVGGERTEKEKRRVVKGIPPMGGRGSRDYWLVEKMGSGGVTLS